MFRIRCVHDALLPINRDAIEQIQHIIRVQFDNMADHKIREIPEKLLNPMKFNFRSALFVCDDRKGRVKGFALFSAEPTLRFGFLDIIALSNTSKGGAWVRHYTSEFRKNASVLDLSGCSLNA